AKVQNPASFGTLDTAVFDMAPYAGKRVRFSADVEAQGITNAPNKGAGLYMRVEDDRNNVLAFDNMGDRLITGTFGENRYEVVLDVAANARYVAFGLWLDGAGEVWASDASLEIVRPGAPYVMDPAAWSLVGKAPQDYSYDVDHGMTRCHRPSAHLR